MGLFGKMFEKKVCDICGGEIGLLGNRKLDDGNLCKECAKKLSPWFEERRHSTVEDIKRQLAYREANKAKVQAFRVTREFAGDSYHVFLDDTKGQFAVASNMSVENNPDIVDLSQVVSCKLEVTENRHEETYKDKEGNTKSYTPPRYTYSYHYKIKLRINSPWFDDMDFSLSSFSVDEPERRKIMELENTGNQIVAALTGNPYGQQPQMMGNGMYDQQPQMMGNGMYGQQPQMMGNGMYGQQPQMMGNGMYGQQPQMMGNGMYGQQSQMMGNGMYDQQPQMMGSGMYGQQPQMMGSGMYGQQSQMGGYQQGPGIRCDKCGWTPSEPGPIPKFCPNCGDPIDVNDMNGMA